MKIANRQRVNRIAQRCLLLALVGLVLIACGGSGSSEPVATNTVEQSVPTPVPTTAPLSLPPADVPLPALAPLPSALAPDEVAADTRLNDTSPTENPAAAENPDATTLPTSSPGEVADPDTSVAPTPADASAVAAAVAQPAAQSISSAARWSDCLLAAADSTQTVEILDAISAGTTVDLSSVQLNSLAAAATGCDIVATALATTDLGDYLPTASRCMNAWLESSGGGSVFVGLASIGWSQPVPPWAQPHLVDALDSCFTGASFAADIMSVVSADTRLAGAFDASCLATSFDASGTLRAFAQALATNPTVATIPVSLSDAWVLNCANVGQMVAVAAAADGVGLSQSTITCIDSELKNSGAIAGLVAGTADTDAVGLATIACLTDAEASALLG